MKTLRGIFAIVPVILALASNARAQSFLTNGLIAYFPFNGNANDASGNSHNGTVVGAATFAVDRFGNSNACLALPGGEGGNCGVEVSSLANIPFAPITYSAWFWMSNYLPTNPLAFVPLVGRIKCSDTQCGAIVLDSHPATGGTNEMVYFNGTDGYIMVQSPPQKTWCQIVFTIDSSGNENFYLNGTSMTSISYCPVGQGPIDFWIGAAAGNGCGSGGVFYVWDGLIDDVRVYNTNLSASNVLQLYQYESLPENVPCPSYYATADPVVTNGFVVGANITFGGCGFTNTPLVLIEGGGGSGATATAVVDNGVVTDIIITDAGIGYTNTPSIFIGYPPAITNQPQSVIVDAGDTNSFSIGAVGAMPLDYQWSFNGTNIAGATLSTLVVSNIAQTNLGSYAVVVTNVFGAVTSSVATLSMYPFLVDPFAGLETLWGYTNTLSVVAWGSGPLTYQWFDDGIAINDATNSSLTFTDIQPTNSGLYTVVVSSPLGSVTNTPEQVVVEPAGVALGLFPGVIITGVAGNTYTIQRTADLSNPNSWATTTNLTLSEPIEIWVAGLS